MASSTTKLVSLDAILYIIHHVFLPPKLPQECDFVPQHENELLKAVKDALAKFIEMHDKSQRKMLQPLHEMIENLIGVLDESGNISEMKLSRAWQTLLNAGGVLPLHVRAQNAGILVTQVDSDIRFEVFELSPTNQSVFLSKGRLKRSFPSRAITVPQDLFKENGFQTILSQTIATMSHQSAPNTLPQVRKAGQNHDENRDTPHPKLVTELLLSFLRVGGQPAKVSAISKNTREEVLWKSAYKPWRRSPTWLLVRVALQLVASRLEESADCSKSFYKHFMIFLMAQLLEQASQHILSSEQLYVMNSKLASRLLKLGAHSTQPWIDSVHHIMSFTHDIINQRWLKIVRETLPPPKSLNLKPATIMEDVFLEIPELDQYIGAIAARTMKAANSPSQTLPQLFEYSPQDLPASLCTVDHDLQTFNLTFFEGWVELYLQGWIDRNVQDVKTCARLADLMEGYFTVASSHYRQDPEGSSVMILIIMELWVAADKSACHHHDLLRDYSPEVPVTLLQSLLLPLKSQMERLLSVENYLNSRQANVQTGARSVFRDFGHAESFAAKYFGQSRGHQSLLANIEAKASVARADKRAEFMKKKTQYDNFRQLHDQSECEYKEVIVDKYHGFRESQHASTCKKCKYAKDAQSIKIQIHEWPLSSSDLEAKCTVFELQVPATFGDWRDATIFLLDSVLGFEWSNSHRPRSRHPIQQYKGLSPFFGGTRGRSRRIQVLSEVKPHTITHRKQKRISDLRESDLCLANGMRLQYFDVGRDVFTSKLKVEDHVLKICTYNLPARSIMLQRYLYRSPSTPNGLVPNTVIARQSECPTHYSLDEFRAFGSLPFGYLIQWKNILTQLSLPSLDFTKVETYMLLLQIMYQAGPFDSKSVHRDAHADLAEMSFCRSMLAKLQEALERVKENWESSRAIACFVKIAARLLSLTSEPALEHQFLEYLKKARKITFRWATLLRGRAQHVFDDAQREEFAMRALEVALVCVSTFQVDQQHLQILLISPADASMLIQSSIILNENIRLISPERDSFQNMIVDQWKKLMSRALNTLAAEIVGSVNCCLDDALKLAWPAYAPGNPWKFLKSPHKYWIACNTAEQYGTNVLSVHFNLLTAEVLVQGCPLARLPSRYETHPTYTVLFGHSVLKVMPSSCPGMEFSSRTGHAGFNVHVGLQGTNKLSPFDSSPAEFLVHAEKGDQKFDLIPAKKFHNKLPSAFVYGCIQWYNPESNSVEFRPIESPWSRSSDVWRLTKRGSSWVLERPGMTLLNMHSDTARALSRRLSMLDKPEYIHLSFNEYSNRLDIEMPRLNLGFYIAPNEVTIFSCQYPGLYVDPDQHIHTLVGLNSKLVLSSGGTTPKRLVIIPEGQVVCQKLSYHSTVTIQFDSYTKAYAYHVDKRLCRLLDNGHLDDKLFLCYLHALTSHSLPDPLTKKTGTEQALSILNSAAVKSFDVLSERQLALLENIANLTPVRTFYPANERVMQTVDWDSRLGFLSQHGYFHTAVQAILDQARATQFLYPHLDIELPLMRRTDYYLLDRDLIRTSTFRVDGFGAEQRTTQYDHAYEPRDCGQNSQYATRVFVLGALVYRKSNILHERVVSNMYGGLWDTLRTCHSIPGPVSKYDDNALKYDSEWLKGDRNLIGQIWCQAHLSLGQSPQTYNKFQVMMWLMTMAFAREAPMSAIHALAALYIVPEVARMQILQQSVFLLSAGYTATGSSLRPLMNSELVKKSFLNSLEANLPKEATESDWDAHERKKKLFVGKQGAALDRFVDALVKQWPCEIPHIPAEEHWDEYLNSFEAMHFVRPAFSNWFSNLQFKDYVLSIERALEACTIDPIVPPSYCSLTPQYVTQNASSHVTIAELFATAPTATSIELPKGEDNLVRTECAISRSNPRLEKLITNLQLQAHTAYEVEYIEHLKASLESLNAGHTKSVVEYSGHDMEYLLKCHLEQCEKHVQSLYCAMEECVRSQSGTSRKTAAIICHWPRVSFDLFLQQLSRQKWNTLAQPWREWVVKFAVALTHLQRAERMVSLVNNLSALTEELSNVGHLNWDPHHFPESLLLEVESGIMIRDVQESIASHMRSPLSGNNAAMQLNMGEGKSSVIVQIVAAALANGTQLVRIIVAKPQSKQMFQMLVSKLGGLLNRRIYHLPFSRALRLDVGQANAISKMCQECMQNGGVLLAQPEHMLSLKLMSVECALTGREALANSLLKTQYFFDNKSRDIVDESDENFSVKFELVYTMGAQRPIELSPGRWTLIHELLGLFARFSLQCKDALPLTLEVDDRWPGRFSKTRILHSDALEMVLARLANHICQTGLSGFPVARQSEAVRNAVHTYITKPELSPEEIVAVEKDKDGTFWTDSVKGPLLLIRGMIAGGVLSFAFSSKRWRVDYGLVADRVPATKLAVPFRAKDSPTPRSEFSHPDVIIVLTSLSYYYGGLSDDDLFNAFGHLLKADQAELEYTEWVRLAPGLPDTFHQLAGVNLKDKFQCTEKIFPILRYSKGAIDYFLSYTVFPKEMKEFPHKISASGWDSGQVKPHPTTCFSGTNDTCQLLPLSVHHLDLPEQKHTNALVMNYLLGDENSVHLLPRAKEFKISDAERLLKEVMKMEPEVRVILDVGAQILELSNFEVAKEWLKAWNRDDKIDAVVYFNNNDELSVLNRKGYTELLQTSPFANQLDACLVYLDEAHTRGTDLKLPAHYRAAVTLGANLTKDRLVQACMRMRKFGKGQSVVFCISDEIKTKIQKRTIEQTDATIGVADVLSWAVSETCLDLQRSMPLWAVQGRRFEMQKALWDASRSNDGFKFSSVNANLFLEDEAQTLEQRYRPKEAIDSINSWDWDIDNVNIRQIIDRCKSFNNVKLNSSSLQEEQERELSPEIEEERQVEKPLPTHPEVHELHGHVVDFVRTGELTEKSEAFMAAFQVFATCSAAVDYSVQQFPIDLKVTRDFARTVKCPKKGIFSDAYQRPPQWILTSSGNKNSRSIKHMVIISPFEAQELMCFIKKYQKVTLHTFAARSNFGYAPLDGLDLYTEGKPFNPQSIPKYFNLLLKLFSGQLYLNSFGDYVALCKFLGLAYKVPEEGTVVRADGFIVQGPGKSRFKDSPVKFLKQVMTKIRRNCEGIEKTHMGKILDGSLLEEADFDM